MFNNIFKNIFYDISNFLKENHNFEVISEINLSDSNIINIDKKCEEIFLKHLNNNSLNIIGYISEDNNKINFFNNELLSFISLVVQSSL